jgi:hypothetical protein
MNKFEINGTSIVDGQLVFNFTYQPVQPLSYIKMYMKTKTTIVQKKTTSVHYWRFETGEPREVVNSIVYPGGLVYSPPATESTPRGWYCWVYPSDDAEFADWMAENCPSSEYTHRFNSGDPMWTVYIKDDLEATIFNLRWL